MKQPIYLDYAATTPIDDRVLDKMLGYMGKSGKYGNPASRSHIYGWQAEEAIEYARGQVAQLIGADVREIIWTSGATESDNLALKGVAHFYSKKGKHIITSKIEHKAVLDSCRQLEKEGFEITYLSPNSDGLITVDQVKEQLRDDTILVSLMHVNNEIGVITDIAAIGALTRSKGVLLHVDAAQSAGKMPINVSEMNIDLLSLSGHKVYGPKGIGALYVRRKPRVRIESQIHGGGHERGMRSGTLPTHQIVGMGEACELAMNMLDSEHHRLFYLKSKFMAQINNLEAIYFNGALDHQVPGILNVSFAYVEGESLMMSLKDLAVSSGSACTSASLEPSYVLRAIGLEDTLAHSSIRFGFGRYTTEEDVDYAANLIVNAVDKLRKLSPLWDMYKEGVDLNQVEWAAH